MSYFMNVNLVFQRGVGEKESAALPLGMQHFFLLFEAVGGAPSLYERNIDSINVFSQ
jgi:hypothetical protein